MHLKHLKLQHFRNYNDLDIDFSDHITALVGLNAQGKTNLLESIAFLALGKSFRSVKSLDTLKWDKAHGRIRGTVEKNGKQTELEVFMQREPEIKKVKKGSRIASPKSFFGSLRIVLFTPDHLDLVAGSPADRRRYLDRLLLQLNGGYVDAFSQFQRILNQRNALLKRINQGRSNLWELDLWDVRLVEESEKIWIKRQVFMDFLMQRLEEDYQNIAGTKEALALEYINHRNRFEEKLIAHRDMDIKMGSTGVGPHRDDFDLLLGGRSLKETGSRGECRSTVLALKVAELNFIEEKTGEKPVLLLDDVFSELDEQRQKTLGAMLENYQSIVTTTSKAHLKGLKNLTIFEVRDGQLKQV
ncbi:MAG: DNA replication/repair protein RecF [Candidatus Gracilibacteria bacterium]